MSTTATIGVNDDLTARKTCVAMRSADYELTCRIDEVLDIVIEERQNLWVFQLSLDTWNKYILHIILNFGKHLLVLIEIIMLGRDNDSVDALRNVVVAILYGYLRLGVWAQISHNLTFLAYLGKGFHKQMGKVKRNRDITVCLVSGVAKHHTLVTSSLLFLHLTRDTHVDIGTLFVNG